MNSLLTYDLLHNGYCTSNTRRVFDSILTSDLVRDLASFVNDVNRRYTRVIKEKTLKLANTVMYVVGLDVRKSGYMQPIVLHFDDMAEANGLSDGDEMLIDLMCDEVGVDGYKFLRTAAANIVCMAYADEIYYYATRKGNDGYYEGEPTLDRYNAIALIKSLINFMTNAK